MFRPGVKLTIASIPGEIPNTADGVGGPGVAVGAGVGVGVPVGVGDGVGVGVAVGVGDGVGVGVTLGVGTAVGETGIREAPVAKLNDAAELFTATGS